MIDPGSGRVKEGTGGRRGGGGGGGGGGERNMATMSIVMITVTPIWIS